MTTSLADQNLAVLVEEWLDWSQVSKRLGVSVGKVRTMIRLHEIAQAVPVQGKGPKVPALFFDDEGIVKGVSGLLTTLHDGRYSDHEAIAWMFLDLDLPGRPIDALRENRGSEAKRRAQAMSL